MSVVLAWLRLDVKRRWRSLLLLAVLIGLSGGVVIAAFSGAHRGITAMDRMLSKVKHPVDAVVLANQPGFDWAPFDRLPYVTGRSGIILANGAPKLKGASGAANVDFLHDDARFITSIDQPVVIRGRVFDQREMEAVVSQEFVDDYGLDVGDTITSRLPSKEQAASGEAESASYADLEGPELTIPIVGVVKNSWLNQESAPNGVVFFSHEPVTKYPDELGPGEEGFVNSVFSLEHGESDISRLRSDLAKIAGRGDIDVWNAHDNYRSYAHSMLFEGRSLQLFAFAALFAAVFLVGQAIARYASSEAIELRGAAALGMTPRTAIASASVPLVLAAVIGAALAAAGSIVASQWFPLGSAQQVEPDPGIQINWLYLAVGVVVMIGFTGLVAAVSSASTLRGRATNRVPRRSVVVARLAEWGLPVPVVMGTSFALERGRGENAVPVRPALIGAVVGVLGVGAVLVFSNGIHHAVDDPTLWGQTYQLAAFTGQGGTDFVPADALNGPMAKLQGVTGIDDGRVAGATLEGGGASAELWSYQDGRRALPTTVLDGRMPEAENEVTLAPATMKAFGTSVGKTITVTADKGDVTLDVVGEAFVPQGPHNGFSSGGWVTNHGFDALFDSFKFRIQFYSLDPAVFGTGEHAAGAVNAALTKANPELTQEGPVVFTPESQELGYQKSAEQLERVGGLPLALAVFLALLAIGTVGHSLGTAVLRRRKDIAVLRAVGMTKWQTRGIVVVHATVLVMVGVIFGIPLGLAIGRAAWRVVADYTPVMYDPPTALLGLSLIVPAALVIAYVVASWPTIRASRLQVATVLRAE